MNSSWKKKLIGCFDCHVQSLVEGFQEIVRWIGKRPRYLETKQKLTVIKTTYEIKDAQLTPTDAYLLTSSKPNIILNKKQIPLLIIRTCCLFITVSI